MPDIPIGTSREFAIVEHIRLGHLLDYTVEFRVETSAELTLIFKLQVKSKTGIKSCPYKIPDFIFCVNFLTYIL